MKPKFYLLLLMFFGLATASFAQKGKGGNDVRTLHFSEAITTLSVDDDLRVVLTNGSSSDIIVEGNTQAIVAHMSDGVLELSSHNKAVPSFATVYVPVGNLSKVRLNGNGVLQSASILNAARLKIYLASEARIAVQSTGAVSVETMNDIQFITGR